MSGAPARPRDVVVAIRPPGVGAGRRMRTSSVIRALARDADVDVLYGPSDPPPPGQELAPTPAVRLFPLRPSARPRRALVAAADVARGRDRQWAIGADRAFARQLAPLLPGARRVIADGPLPMLALLAVARRRPVVLLAHNVESHIYPRRGVHHDERRVLRAAAEVWMCTAADVAAIPRIAGESRPARVVRNVVDVAAVPPRAGHVGRDRALLVADLAWEPNREAVRHLAEDVLPELRRLRPGLEILVAGAGTPPVPDRPGLRHLGFVDDLEALYATVDAALVPVRRGSGSPLKLVEGLAHGIPTVVTPHAAALVPEAADGRELLVGRDPTAFAAHVAGALAGEAEAVGAAGRALAERCYSIETLADVLAPPGPGTPDLR